MALFIYVFIYLTNALYVLGENILGLQTPLSLGGGCPLPPKPKNGDFEVTDCIEGDFSSKCRKIEGTIVSSYVIITYSCDPGYVLDQGIDHSYCSRKGYWLPQPPTCQKQCKGVNSNSMNLQCLYLGDEVDCNLPARPGTVLKAECKDTYQVEDGSTSFRTTHCLSNGTWAHGLYKCVPECGIKNTVNEVMTTIKGGMKVHQFEYPWHAGLFLNEEGTFVYHCGGTIIHPRAVLTAGNCVYNDTLNILMDVKTMGVAVGKYRRNWNYIEASTEQKFKVKQSFIAYYFRGLWNLYEQDIAILELDKSIKFDAAVMPICFDIGERLHLYQGPNAVGNVVGWSGTGTGVGVNEEFRVAKFQVRPYHVCRRDFNDSHFFSYDKFCAGSPKDTNLERGDDGSGLTFPRFTYGVEQHFIYGLFSLYPLPNRRDVATFTNITEHMKWINETLNRIEQSM